MQNRALLIILDGFGIGSDNPFNAIRNAHMPFYNELVNKYPNSQLLTHGAAVGLPDGVMGNSEVGHMTMGSGRVIYQDLVRINHAIADKSFFGNQALRGLKDCKRLHLLGLLSDGGVHSHLNHLLALLDWSLEQGTPEVYVHAFMDGRDTPPDSGKGYLDQLLRHPAFGKGVARLGTISGRYYAMDRDKRWERIRQAQDALFGRHCTEDGYEAVVTSSPKGDEFIKPVCLDKRAGILAEDGVVFFNYRADRAREMTLALTQGNPEHPQEDDPKVSNFVAMTQYDASYNVPVAFAPNELKDIFGQVLERNGLTQFRCAETEKYAHVTFFFNGGREESFKGEERTLIPSPKDVATYDERPEMSALAVTDEMVKRIESGAHKFLVVNYANPDMVGHTGNYAATCQAMEALDKCLARVIGSAEKSGYSVFLTADHGNAEEMQDCEGRPHTQHTLNPVPAVYLPARSSIAPKAARGKLLDGTLADLMPTLCTMMKLPIPESCDGKSLIP